MCGRASETHDEIGDAVDDGVETEDHYQCGDGDPGQANAISPKTSPTIPLITSNDAPAMCSTSAAVRASPVPPPHGQMRPFCGEVTNLRFFAGRSATARRFDGLGRAACQARGLRFPFHYSPTPCCGGSRRGSAASSPVLSRVDDRLMDFSWADDIRQVQNVLEHSAILSDESGARGAARADGRQDAQARRPCPAWRRRCRTTSNK